MSMVPALLDTGMQLFFDDQQKLTKSVNPQLTGQFNDIIAALMPSVQGPTVTDEELDQLLTAAFARGQKAFAPNQALQAGAGGYNSTALEALQNDAMAKALNEGIATILDTKLKANQQQTEAANVAGSLVTQQSATTASTQQTSGKKAKGGMLGLLGDTVGKVIGCYITTATMEATGNSDDGSYELTTMRKFRDDFMAATPVGQELIDNYYQVAPLVVAKLSARPDAKEIYSDIYNSYLAPAIAAIESGDNYRALSIYRAMSQHAEAIAAS